MKKVLLMPILLILMFTLVGCGKTDVWQGYYYEHGLQENEMYGPVYTTYDACKAWALNKITYTDDAVNCSKNCGDGYTDGTAVCEEVVRNRALLPGSVTFNTYKE